MVGLLVDHFLTLMINKEAFTGSDKERGRVPNCLLESLDEEEGFLAANNNDIWDWDGNNDK